MFMMFAMTTDSVGVIIPEIIKEFHLNMTVAGAFHYASMSGIAFAGFALGYLADKLGRKRTIILGLVLFALNSYLFAVGDGFALQALSDPERDHSATLAASVVAARFLLTQE